MLGCSTYMRCFLASLFVSLSSFPMWADVDSTYTALVKDCVERDFMWLEGYEWPSRKYDQYKRQALDLGYSELESENLLTYFRDEVCQDIYISYISDFFAEELSCEDMRAALTLFSTEEGTHATESLNFFASEEFRQQLTDLILYDMAELLIEKKVTKKKCDVPKPYQKLFRSYMISSGWDEYTVNAAVEQLVPTTGNEGDKLMFQYFTQNLQTIMVQFFYRNVPVEDLRFLHAFSSSGLGVKFGRISKKALEDIVSYYELVDREFSSFLKKEYETHPPKVLEVSPQNIPDEGDAHG